MMSIDPKKVSGKLDFFQRSDFRTAPRLRETRQYLMPGESMAQS